MLNNYFDQIFCINLDRRPDRLEKFTEMANHLGFTFNRWPAVDGLELRHPNGQIMEENERRNMELACKLSHKRLIRYAKEVGYHSIMIFEDDARLNEFNYPLLKYVLSGDEFHTELNGVDQWHMFYLGFNDINKTKEDLGNNICRIRTGFTTHAYAVHNSAYDLLLNALDYRGQADVLYADYIHPLGHSYAINPNIAYQEDGFSDITLKEESYHQLK